MDCLFIVFIVSFVVQKLISLIRSHLFIFALIFIALRSYFFFFLFWAAPMAHGGSQARGLSGAVAAGLHCSHSDGVSELHLRPTPQLTATPDP